MMEIMRVWALQLGYSLEPGGGYAHNGLGYNFELLCKRPRVDYRISEYVMEYISKTILKPNSPLNTGNYMFSLHFYPYDKDADTVPYNIYTDMPSDTLSKYYLNVNEHYNTEDTRFETNNSSWGGIYNCSCYSAKLDENITPKEYAGIVYDMIGAFLGTKYKRITKEVMDSYKSGLDYGYIESFKFPATFENQRYASDEITGAYHYTEGEGKGVDVAEYKKLRYKKYFSKHTE